MTWKEGDVQKALVVTGLLLMTASATAQDAAKANPEQVRVVTEDEQVRVLRYRYAPHAKTGMHSHPAAVDIALTDGRVRLTTADGKTVEHQVKAGDVHSNPPTRHFIENLSDSPFEGMIVEIKCPAKKEAGRD